MRSDESKLVSIEDAAQRLGLKAPTLRLWAAQRKMASVKLGRRRLIPQAEIERLIEANLTLLYPSARDEHRASRRPGRNSADARAVPESRIAGDGNFWCAKTQRIFGPDDNLVGDGVCRHSGRSCFESHG